MILFCDTSALLKLYVAEASSAAVLDLVDRSDAVAVCRIAWAEAHAALSRRARLVPADAAPVAEARRAFAEDWPRWIVVDVTQALVERAGTLADAFALRGYDSVQLAAAQHVAAHVDQPLAFACFDGRLNQSAAVLGMAAPFHRAH